MISIQKRGALSIALSYQNARAGSPGIAIIVRMISIDFLLTNERCDRKKGLSWKRCSNKSSRYTHSLVLTRPLEQIEQRKMDGKKLTT